jgi:nucleoside-diphosphate-sugar epimerase
MIDQPRAGAATTPTETVLVTGATGFLGSRLVERLLSDGSRVRVLVRSTARARGLADRGAAVVVGDITDRGKLAAAADGAAVVYHVAGRLLVPGVAPQEYERVHVEGTQALVSLCQSSSSLRRFVHVSTTGVLGVTGNTPAPEDAPMRPTNVYEATKARAEMIVRESWGDGFPAAIARPGLVYGPRDLHLLPFFDSVLRRRFRPIGSPPVLLHPIYVDDLIDALALCGCHPSAEGECFHLADRTPVSLAELARTIARAGGTRLPAGYIPMPAARAVALVGDRLPVALRRSAPLTTSRLDFLTHSRVYDTSKAARLIGFTAATDIATGVARTIAWYWRERYLPTLAAAA